MKASIYRFSLILVATFGYAAAFAQEAPPQQKAAAEEKRAIEEKRKTEYEAEFATQLNDVHSRKSIWSEKQCSSCHAGVHSLARESRLLLAAGTVANALGIEVAPLDGTLRAHLNIDDKSGLVLSSVPEGSEGGKAGLKPHDVVLNVNQQAVNDPAKFNELLGTLSGKKAQLGLLRQGKPLSLEVTVPQVPLAFAADFDQAGRIDWIDNRYRIGVTLSEADSTLRSHLKLAAGEGLVVTEVVDDSPAAKMGVKLHDVLTELDGKRLTSVEAINSQIQGLKDKTVVLKLLRSGQEVTCQIAAKKSSEPSATTFQDVILVPDGGHSRSALVRWFDVIDKNQEPSNTDAAAQLAELKKQLSELSKTVEKLEAVIAPPAPPAEEKKPNESPNKK